MPSVMMMRRTEKQEGPGSESVRSSGSERLEREELAARLAHHNPSGEDDPSGARAAKMTRAATIEEEEEAKEELWEEQVEKAKELVCEEKEEKKKEDIARLQTAQDSRLRRTAKIMTEKHGSSRKKQAAEGATAFLDSYLDACEGRVVIVSEKRPPFLIVGCTEGWCDLCGFTSDDAVGCAPGDLLQGRETDTGASKAFARTAVKSGHATAKLVNYTKDKVPFVHCLETFELTDPGTGTEYFATESHEHEKWRAQKWSRGGAVHGTAQWRI